MRTTAQAAKDKQLAAFAAHLHNERIRQNRSVMRTAKALAIERKRLIGLELWEKSQLPPEPFRVGLLNSYADLLGVATISPAQPRLRSRQLLGTVGRTGIVSRWLVGGVVSVAILSLAAYVFLTGWSYFAPPKLMVTQATQYVTKNDFIQIQGTTSKQTIVRIDGQAVTVDEDGRFTSGVYVRSGQNDITITAINSLGRQATTTYHVYR
jgi:cytoskeletal protein RodZ